MIAVLIGGIIVKASLASDWLHPATGSYHKEGCHRVKYVMQYGMSKRAKDVAELF